MQTSVVSSGSPWIAGILFFCAMVLTPSTSGQPTADKPLVFRRTLLKDPYLQKDCFSLLVPDGWKTTTQFVFMKDLPQGSIGCLVVDPATGVGCRGLPEVSYLSGVRESRLRNVRDPAMRAEIEKLWADGTQVTGSEIRTLPASPRDCVEKVLIPRFFPDLAKATDLKFISEKDLGDLAKARTAKDPKHWKHQSARMRFSATVAGEPREIEFVCILNSGKNPNGESPWNAQTTAYFAPAGTLDGWMPTLNSIIESLQLQFDWYVMRLQVGDAFVKWYMQITAQQMADAFATDQARMNTVHELAMKASNERSEKFRESFARQQQDRSENHKQMMNYINNTTSYLSHDGSTSYTLPANYNFQYLNNHGDVIQTNDATYHPPVSPDTSWEIMQKEH